MRRLIVLAALALSACGGPEKNPNAPVAAPDHAANFNEPIDARGADPAWSLKIRGLQFTLERPGQPDIMASAPGATLTPYSASWSAGLADGQKMKVSLYASPCTEMATGTVYSFSAEVLLPGSAPLGGCGGKPVPPPAKR